MTPGMSSRAGGTAPSSDARGAARQSNIPAECRELLPSTKLAELMDQVAPGETLHSDVEEFLQEHIDDFVDSVTEFACLLAKHRKSRTVEARDFQVHLEKKWNIRVPGYGDDPRPPAKRNAAAPVHNARLQAIAKSQAQHHRANPAPLRPILQQSQGVSPAAAAAAAAAAASRGPGAGAAAGDHAQAAAQQQQQQGAQASQATPQASPSQPSPAQMKPTSAAASQQAQQMHSQTATPSQPQSQ